MIGCGIGVGVSRPRGLERAIMALFAAGEKGVFYDVGDFSTLYQDSAGTTPVTAVGQVVGMVLDKSKGLVLGPELVTNGGFDTDVSSWTDGAGISTSVSGGQVTVTRTADGTTGITQNLVTVIGKSYHGVVVCSSGTSIPRIQAGSFDSGAGFTNGTYTFLFTATATSTEIKLRPSITTTGATATFDNISVRELPGYHATQSTSTARAVNTAIALDYDGVDDATLQASAGGGTTGFFMCAAVRPDGGAGAVRTIWSDAGTNTGYILRLNASNQLELAAGNGTAYTLAATTDTLAVGTTYVVTAFDDGTNLSVQVNSGTAGTASRPVVSAGTSTATIGKDNGAASSFFNGTIGPLVYVKNGQNVDSSDRAAVKTYVAGKAGVSL